MKIRNLMLLLAPLLLCLLISGPVSARVYLDITAPQLRKINLAVPPFVDQSKPAAPTVEGRMMADIMGRALDLHGFVSLIDPKFYGERQDADWVQHGVEFVVKGLYRQDGEVFTLELKLLDITGGRMIHRRHLQTSGEMTRQAILRYADEVVAVLTGEKGISQSKIAFVSSAGGHKEVYLADILGDHVRQVTRHQFLALSPRFTPDGKYLTYTSHHHGNADLYKTCFRELRTTRAISRWAGLNLAPSWLPGGDQMILTLSRDGNPDLYLATSEGAIIRRLTHGEGVNVSPSLAPDGRRLAFVSDRGGTPQIFIMDLETMAIQRLTFQGNHNTTPDWSPDGRFIAYTGRTGEALHIFIIRPEGGPPTQITRTWGQHEGPSWSPDSRQLVFSRQRHDREEICAIFIDGSGLRVLFADQPGNHSMPRWSPRLSQ